MTGYQSDFSMSNNARAAYGAGLVPASKVPGVPAALVREFCRPREWHHSSKAYNKVEFFDPAEVRAIFGIETCEDTEADPRAVAALAARKGAKPGETVHANCIVEWIEWSGSLKRPVATERKAAGCTVVVKGQTATVTHPDWARLLVKRLTTNGFSFKPAP
jgi:hypothetical protein